MPNLDPEIEERITCEIAGLPEYVTPTYQLTDEPGYPSALGGWYNDPDLGDVYYYCFSGDHFVQNPVECARVGAKGRGRKEY